MDSDDFRTFLILCIAKIVSDAAGDGSAIKIPPFEKALDNVKRKMKGTLESECFVHTGRHVTWESDASNNRRAACIKQAK